MNYLCYMLFCTSLLSPSPHHCTEYLGEPTEAATSKLIDAIVNRGMAYSVCGTMKEIKKSEIYKQMKGK